MLDIGQEVLHDGTTFPFLEISGVDNYWFNPNTKVFVAMVADQLAGTYAIKPNLPGRGDHVCNAGYMVAKAWRGRGIGRALAEHSIEQARADGYQAMQYNHVISTNPAVGLWKSIGFGVVGEVPDAFRLPSGEHVSYLVMYKKL